MGQNQCGWAGCSNDAEATLDRRPLCRIHFYEIASKRIAEHRDRLSKGDPVGANRAKMLGFVSELIGETTTLVVSAKLLGQEQRDKYLQLSLSTAELYKLIQRDPRVARNVSILISGGNDSDGTQELTKTVNVSKREACIATMGVRKPGELICIQKPQSTLRALARVAWVKQTEQSQFLIGLEILDCLDFWK